MRSFRVRTMSSVFLIAAYLAVIWGGHVPLMLLILACQVRCESTRHAPLPAPSTAVNRFDRRWHMPAHAAGPRAGALHACSRRQCKPAAACLPNLLPDACASP